MMKVAFIHYWLTGMRGGEKVLEALCDIFPEADIYTHVYRPERLSKALNEHNVTTTFIHRLPFSQRLYQKYLPLMPLALEQLDLREYDLVISSESGPAKGVLTGPNTVHVCYCHTPMRYVWNMYPDYRAEVNSLLRPLMSWLIHRLRIWDFQSAARVDAFIANSHNVARRIRKYYNRDAVVVYPPVDVDSFVTDDQVSEFYLYVGQLVRYKRVDIAIKAFNSLGKPLIVIGDGEELRSLRKMAGPTITFLGRQEASVLREHYARCKAIIFPGEEDFGIVPLEAMASGRPVIAFKRGGVLETVVPESTGIFFEEQTSESLLAAVRRFETISDHFDPRTLASHARQYSTTAFKTNFLKALVNIAAGLGARHDIQWFGDEMNARLSDELSAHRSPARREKHLLAYRAETKAGNQRGI